MPTPAYAQSVPWAMALPLMRWGALTIPVRQQRLGRPGPRSPLAKHGDEAPTAHYFDDESPPFSALSAMNVLPVIAFNNIEVFQ